LKIEKIETLLVKKHNEAVRSQNYYSKRKWADVQVHDWLERYWCYF
jgi:hypothetical protein